MLIALVVLLPMFGQKRNSRGEKMVKSIIVKGYMGTVILTFDYDENSNMVTAKCVRSHGRGPIEKNAKFWLLEKTENNIAVTTNQKTFWYGDNRDNVIHKYAFETNNEGLIKGIVFPGTDNFDDPDGWYHIGFRYGKSNDGHYMLVTDTVTWWIHEEGKKPKRKINSEPLYEGCSYSYDNEEHQYRRYQIKKGGSFYWGCYIPYTYGDIKNDTNIGFGSLFDGNSLLENFIHATEWSPIYTPLMPIANENNKHFNYIYEKNNIVRIEKYDDNEINKPLLEYSIEIEYVED